MKRWIVPLALVLAALIWTGTVAAAYRAVRLFETTPGEAATAPSKWPSKSAIRRADGEWSLVMLVHPRCSCSRASVQELQAVLEKSPRSVRTHVLVYRPSDFAPGWEQTDVVDSAKRLRRANVIIDENGREADLFGGFTSGQTFLYDGGGKLRFAGGITSLRGHAGLNSGRTDLIDIVNARAESGDHPVFGCAISSREKKETR
ncbi:MAG TPA: RedB protein [Thermoanaerobaculia bacterium]|nr:RedB protein [Thermoanaerobaculia bacterium]